MSEEPSFETLMSQVADGDEIAFSRLVNQFSEEILNYFYKHCWDADAADDLAQDVFVRLYTKRNQFKASGSGKGYMYSIARNLWVDYCRKQATRREVFTEVDQEDSGFGINPAEQLDLSETEQAIQNALAELSEDHREACIMVCFQKISYKEVAEALGAPLGTIKSRVHNAIKRLQDTLRVDYGIN